MAARNNAIEKAIAALIIAREFDHAAHIAERLPKGRQRKALRAIVKAIG